MSTPSVSVVIPAFNMEALVARAIESAWSQDPRPADVIVASDGSTDKTLEVARAAGAEVLDLPKANGNVARNAGARHSKGDVLFFLDADDWFMPGKIAAHLEQHTKGDWSCVIDSTTRILASGQEMGLCGPPLNGPIEYSGFTSRTHWYGGSGYSVSRKNLEKIGGFREDLTSQQDVDFWLRVAHACGPAFVLPRSYTYYLVSQGSLSRNPKNVIPNLKRLIGGLSFLSRADQRRLWSHVIFTTADNLPIGKALPYLLTAWDRAYDPRFAKSLWRSLARTLRS